jgi:hypothetical protein
MNRVTFDSPFVLGGEEEEEDPLDAFLRTDAPAAPASTGPTIEELLAQHGGGEDADVMGALGGAQTDLALESAAIPEDEPVEAAPAPARGLTRSATAPTHFDTGVKPDREMEAAQRNARNRSILATVARGVNAAFGDRNQDAVLADIQGQSDAPVHELEARRRSALEQHRAQRAMGREDAEDALKAQRRDPASPINRRFQEALRTRFGDAISDDVLGQMTVEDSESVGLLGARQAAAERLESDVRTRAQQLDDFERQRGATLEMEGIRHAGDLEEIAARNAGRRRPGGGGGGGGAPFTDRRAQFIDQIAQQTGRNRAELEVLVPSNPHQFDMFARSYAADSLIRDPNTDATTGVHADQVERQHRVPGWSRSADAPQLSQAELSDVRQAAGQIRIINDLSHRMRQIAQRIRAAERVRGAIGDDSPLMAEARQTQEQLSNALRTAGNYGVPNGTELERMERLAPRLDTVRGFLGAENQYEALNRTMWNATKSRLSEYGYTFGGGAGGSGGSATPPPAGGAAGGDRVRVRLPNGRTGTIPRSQLEAARARGAEPI